MARIKARSISPQYTTDSLGSIWATAKGDILKGSVVVVTGVRSKCIKSEYPTQLRSAVRAKLSCQQRRIDHWV